MSDKYTPRFRPEVYLKFLNEKMLSIFSAMNNYRPFIVSYLTVDEKGTHDQYGGCIEECLDQAILDIQFEKEFK